MFSIARSLLCFTAFIMLAQSLVVRHSWTDWNNPVSVCTQGNTTSGLITGHPASGYPGVIEYLGIPFAEPPIGELRFAPPSPYIARGPITANQQSPSCIQQRPTRNTSLPQPAQNIEAASPVTAISEDCLYLNVWTPRSHPGTALKPVLIWVYGGGFHAGAAADPSEQGAIFAAEQDVLLINFNYRLGVFGFPGAPDLTQNLGLLDQRLLIEWVRDNAAAFGGDPNRITLIGHSAGGASIDYYAYAYKDDPIVAGIIFQSGSSTSFGHRTAATGVKAWDAMAELLACGNATTTSSAALLSCVKGKSTADVFNASLTADAAIVKTLPEADQFYAGITGIWNPTTDNVTVFANYSTLGQQGKFAQIPTVTGSDDDEACLFSEKGQVPTQYDPLLTEEVFTCPIDWAATYRASANVPTWRYRYFGSFPNVNFNVCPGEAWHGEIVDVYFGSTEVVSNESATAQEVATGRYLRKAWATFARDPTIGLSRELQWPTFDSDTSKLVALGLNTTEFAVVNATAYDAPCSTPDFLYGGPNY